MPLREITPPAGPVWGGHYCPPNAGSKIAQAGNSRRRILPAICAVLLALAPYATAQRTAHAAPRPATQHFNLPRGSHTFVQSPYLSRFQRYTPYTSLPFPFFTDSVNPDDVYSTGYPVASQPPVFLWQAARAMAGSADYPALPENNREPSSAQPLMIELQNGRYVRLASTPANGEALPLTPAPNTHPDKAQTLPPAVLVFRDGHREEVRDYAIANGILYARGDYYTDGYWNKDIELSTLDIPKTLQSNSTRNVNFVLPKSPNEVITRP